MQKFSFPWSKHRPRIDDHERRPPPLTKRETSSEREREREGEGERDGGKERGRGEKKATFPVDIFAAQAMKVPIQVFETVKRAKIRVEKRRVV